MVMLVFFSGIVIGAAGMFLLIAILVSIKSPDPIDAEERYEPVTIKKETKNDFFP